MADTSIGIEFDGNRVTVVETVGEMAVSIRTISIEDRAEAVELALAGLKVKRGDPAIRIALGSASMVARKIDVTVAMLERNNFEDVAYKAMPVDRLSTSAAGLFFEKDELKAGIDKLSTGFAAISPSNDIGNAYQAMAGRKSEVVPLPFVFDGYDGLWLGARYAASDLTLVVDGHVVAYRQLRAGGLNSIAGVLADPDFPESGIERLESFINKTSASDPIVDSEIARWVRSIALEVKQTIEFWTRSGESIPEGIALVGSGSEIQGLANALGEVEIKTNFPEELNRVMAFINPSDRASAVVAYMAARSSGFGSPQAVYIDPEKSNRSKNNLLRNKKVVTIVTGSTIAVLLGALVVAPTTAAWIAKRDSDKLVIKTQSEFSSYQGVYDKIASLSQKKSFGKKALIGETNYGSILKIVSNTAPAGYTITQLSASKNDTGELVATVSSCKNNGTYTDLVNWLKALRSKPEVYQAWSSSFTSRDGVTSFQISITFKNSELLVTDRTIKGAFNE